MVLVAPQGTGQALEIMLVEDSLLDARVTIESLRNCGFLHRLTLFRDGHEAIEFLHQRGVFARAPQPDVILLDLYLPDTDGVSFLRQLRTDPRLMNIPVVVLTSSGEGTYRQQCEQLGVSSYITKPFNEDKFLAVMRRLKGLSLTMESSLTPVTVVST
ncbi:MAG: response regulator [Pirellulaceae bacterium]